MAVRFRLSAVCAMWAAATIQPAAAQVYLQQGNAMDANNRVGSGGLNYGARDYRVNQGNRIMTGNQTGGASFRGYTPIRDSNSLFLGNNTADPNVLRSSSPRTTSLLNTPSSLIGASGLPSDRLNDFRRDSIGGLDPRTRLIQGYSQLPQLTRNPYYSPTSTVTNTGQIARGLNQPGTSQVRSPYDTLRADLAMQPTNPLTLDRTTPLSSTRLDTRLVRGGTGRSVTGQINPRLLASPLFGGIRQVPVSELAAQADRATAQGLSTPEQSRMAAADAQREMLSSTQLNASASPALARLLGQAPAEPTSPLMGAGSLAQPTEPQGQPSTGQPQPNQPAEEIRPSPPSNAGVAEGPLKTFVGTQETRFNREMAVAEQALRQQQYYDAARHYEMAGAIDARSPLPLLGRAMSLLAAGDFLSSSNALFTAIRVSEEVSAYDIDLTKFVSDLNVLDRRRAFIEQQLVTFDDFRLRFLLGWAEYSSGLKDIGLGNMRKAAEAVPPNLDAVRRFVERLVARQGSKPETSLPATRPG